ncbi:hypothetical protein PIB30_069547 [Stylosanthes scabra]|uniref:Retrotransposon gag domain-containing protein n=1 Tax=Stylosanthes scabra TaxID=79078 RepID=A0ABU6QN92_9FABA|nr:hypothetical protein [Stylosanthes scabra]
MLRSNSYPNLLVFDPKIEITLRKVRRRIKFENNRYFQAEELASDEGSVYSSAFETDIEIPSSETSTDTMGDNPRRTLKELGGASVAHENHPVRRTGGDEDAVKAFALLFSLEGKAKDWYYTLSGEITDDRIRKP